MATRQIDLGQVVGPTGANLEKSQSTLKISVRLHSDQ
nr:MAG TPA: hypothetical protein [Caudoviricetes sp.]